MAKKKKDPWEGLDPSSFQGMFHHLPPDTKLIYGLGALFLGCAAFKYMPKTAEKLIPILALAFQPPRAAPHPEALEPTTTVIDERQLGRSEVIRAIANPKRN